MTSKQPAHGMKTRFMVIKQQACPECNGWGEIRSLFKLTYTYKLCPACQGGKFSTELIDLELALAELTAKPNQADPT